MGSLPPDAKSPWVNTPCLLNPQISKATGCNVYLKFDNLQPSGSFKSRGIGNLMTIAAQKNPSPSTLHFYCSSGGNAGLACATAARALKLPATIVVPMTTSPLMKDRLEALGVKVHQTGDTWDQCDRFMREELIPKEANPIYVPPFDHPDIWAGASSIVREAREQVEGDIDAFVCSVGGGGLVNGIIQGVRESEWSADQPRVLAVETQGADSLHASLRAGEHLTLPNITSIAKSLGGVRVSDQTWAHATSEPRALTSLLVSDADAAISCVRFADDARHLVEPACGATLAVAYRGDLRKQLGEGLTDKEWSEKTVVLLVCGGQGVTLKMLEEYRATYKDQSSIELPEW